MKKCYDIIKLLDRPLMMYPGCQRFCFVCFSVRGMESCSEAATVRRKATRGKTSRRRYQTVDTIYFILDILRTDLRNQGVGEHTCISSKTHEWTNTNAYMENETRADKVTLLTYLQHQEEETIGMLANGWRIAVTGKQTSRLNQQSV